MIEAASTITLSSSPLQNNQTLRIFSVLFFFAMDSSNEEIAYDFSPFFIVYKDSRVVQLKGNVTVPPSLDPKTNVESKDIVYLDTENIGLSARVYIPGSTHQNQKLPLLVNFHGGCFCMESAFSPTYHNYLNSLVAEAGVIAVSVEYRQAPENPVPCPHNDSWTALKWVASHFKMCEQTANVVGYGLNSPMVTKHDLPMRRLPRDVRVFGSMRLCLREA
ncbi:hypothetical protein Q3G72_031982 [Acer saccharum]|nr:hypothetical protein Q3G72_031982 [Acer saccharum]